MEDEPRVAKPVLMLLKGHPGCGKSTLGRNVARSLGWSLVDKDDAKGALQRCAIECAGVDAVSYDIMFSAARTLLRVGLSVIVDCPLSRRALYDKASALAEQFGARLVVVECEAKDESVWRSRLASRSENASEEDGHKPKSWEELQALLERYQECWKWSRDGSVEIPHQLFVDTTASDEHSLASEVVKWLRESLPDRA